MDFIIEFLPQIFAGFLVTIQLTFFGVLMGLALAIPLAVGDLYGGKIVSTIIKFYVEFFRGSALVAQLFIFYFSIPTMLNIRIDWFIVGLVVFALNSAAYQKGYIKGAMESVYKDQMTAALSIGLSKVQAIIYVVLPQALRIVIPAWSNEFCSLAKSTSAILVVGGKDLTATGRTMASQTWRILESYTFIALIYFLWITTVMKALDILYNKVKIPGLEVSA